MQQEKIEFPKFTVPGQTNWVKWVLASVGGLVVLSAFAFGVALARRTPAPTASAAQASPAPDVPLAPSATPRPAPRPSAALAATGAAPVETAAASDDAPAPARAASHRPRRSHGGHARTLAKAGSSSSKSGKPDAIDELLKRFK
jgi:hypothetical protein